LPVAPELFGGRYWVRTSCPRSLRQPNQYLKVTLLIITVQKPKSF
jgi:hypothetical protein